MHVYSILTDNDNKGKIMSIIGLYFSHFLFMRVILRFLKVRLRIPHGLLHSLCSGSTYISTQTLN